MVIQELLLVEFARTRDDVGPYFFINVDQRRSYILILKNFQIIY